MLSRNLAMSEFIPVELASAPQPKGTLPNLKLETILINQTQSFQLWRPKWTPKGVSLKPQEIELLKSDRLRVNRILSKLVWLMGAICIAEDDWDLGDRQPIYDWDAVLEFVRREGRCTNPIVTRVIFNPQTFIPIYDAQGKLEGKIPPQAWENVPVHWSIIFDNLVTAEDGFLLKPAENFVSVEIWTGKPVRREMKTGKHYVEYNDIYAVKRR